MDIDLAELYHRKARDYDRVRTRSLMELPYLERAVEIAPPPGAVLDLGCGAGEPIARYFIDQGYEVTGIDFAEEMLSLCRSRFPEMTWLHEDMRRLELPRRFEVVIAWDSFFHLSPMDQRGIFPRFSKLTAPGGALVFTSGTREGEETGGNLCGEILYHGSLDSEEYARLLDRHGFEVVHHRVDDPECGRHTVWVARRR